ncbi:glycosyl hydrolase family 25 [Streptococcus parasanguinis ATCC 15912]|uniref:Glycosyl hydrolase family 25 n=4 Tax=Streptococcus parasanguinis TaxID=1318 RepID=F8DKM6_STREP|nr:glycosyl hydrolase family 25 [Streptococcus parasanguinis ATCC 15912]
MYKGRTMRKKDLIYFASAALLLSVSAQVAKADEVTSNEPVTADNNHQQVAPSVETKTGEELVPATSYTAPATVVESTERASQLVASAVTSSVSSEETASATESTTAAPQEKPSVGASTFFDAGSHAPASRSTDVAVQPKTFVDVSSHNGDISVEDYRVLANKGVGGVVVKLTENTWYNNPNAASQIRNAQAVGLQVSTYHFSRYTTEEAARAEARFYIAAAQRLGLPKSTLMVNDFEDAKMQPNINRNTQAWADEMRKNGYTNLMFYTSASWLDENNLHKKGPVNTAQFGIENFWVAQYPAPKLSANDAKTLRYNGKAGAWQFSSQAELLPGKHLFDHNIDYTGRFTANYKQTSDPTQGNLSGKISVINNDTMTGRFDVLISDVKAPNGVASVSVPIWSDVNGQDDLVWYVAAKQNDGTYKVSVKASDHKNSTGKYNIHLYYNQLNGKQIGVTTSSTEVSIGKRPNVPVSADLSIDVDKSAGTFTITAKNLKGFENYKEIKIPFWSHAKGMDDIKWYTPVRQSDGSYKVVAKASDHENVDGRYEAQIFYYDAQGQRQFVQKAFAEYSTGKPNVPVSADLSIDVDKSAGTFTITAKNLKGFENYKEIKIPFWSHAKGMDDIKWYTPVRQSDGSYKVVAKASDHENVDGRYEAQIFYYDAQGQRKFVQKAFAEYSTGKLNVPVSADLSIDVDKSAGTFTITAKNLKGFENYKEIKIPFWSHAKGMDDIKWYTPVRQSDGSYKVVAKASDHENVDGRYEAQIFYYDAQGQRQFVQKAFAEYSTGKPNVPVSADLSIDVDKSAGTFTITAKNLKGFENYKEIKIPFWSHAKGMDDIKWYTPVRQSDGSYKVVAKASDHENVDGRYEAQIFYYDAQGQRQFVQKAFAEYKKEQLLSGTLSIENNNKDTGTFDVIIKDVYSPKGVRTVQVPIWSAKDGQDDIRWYEAARQANGDYKVSVTASDHKNSTGLYYVHLYYIQNDGSRVGVLASSTEVEFRNANTKTRAFIKNVNVEAGTYTVEVDQAPQGRQIKNVRVAAWSQDHQENLYWYSTAPTGTQTDVHVSAVNHKNLAGNYTTHVYVDYVDGGVEGFNLGQTALNPRGTTGQTGLSPRVDSGQRDRVLRAAASLVGIRGGSAAHQQLVNDYNSVRPLPVGYAVKNTDDWCDVFVTTIFQREGLSDLVGRECGVERHIQIFKRLGIWNEDGGSTPKAGDIITFNWDQDSQPNNGFADHIGIVESVSNGIIHTIEGNSNDQVRRKTYRIGHGNIRGFASPRYQ